MKTRLFLIALASTGLASAFTQVQTQTFSFVPDGFAPLTFQRFDDGGYLTLNSITITTSLTKSGGSLYIDNDSASAATGNITQSVTINLSSLDVTLAAIPTGLIGANIVAQSTYAATTAANNGDAAGYDIEPGGPPYPINDFDGTAFTPVTVSQTKNVKPAFFSDYTSTGLTYFNIDANGTQGFSAAAFGGASIAIAPANAAGSVTITYDYIPEPGAALLGGLGFLALLRRRR